ncbi:hypothetical protein [Bifidobacterium simiarum]|uniref:SWIM-type domain-containing protein n=1 Tax=Bifidobacterium simiarum TaxID=2045441 RepID=A0A2M9HE32_9BIFI|nr:hypothetical protein [Bifidobacterium simiarum]PJM75061.1 hypothetical protein CSQ87_07515 [Bifidobacterium simiarum]
MEFSTLLYLPDSATYRQLLRDGRRLYECAELRNIINRNGLWTADIVDPVNGKPRYSVTVRSDGETITAMSCTCADPLRKQSRPSRCVHVCALCFMLFYRHRYRSSSDDITIPRETTSIVEWYLSKRLNSQIPYDTDAVRTMADGLEILTDFRDDNWDVWLGNRHFHTLLGNCMPTVEESTDITTESWPNPDAPDLDATLPHGWLTLLEAAYERLRDTRHLIRLYALYLIQGKDPTDCRYVDRLRWMLSGNREREAQLNTLIDDITRHYQPREDNQRRPIPNPAYEHLLRVFERSDDAVTYCNAIHDVDRHCIQRLEATISLDHPEYAGSLRRIANDWKQRYDSRLDYDIAHFTYRAEKIAPALFANGYHDPIIDDCTTLMTASARGSKAAFRITLRKRFHDTARATICRDLIEAVRNTLTMDDLDRELSAILRRTYDGIAPHTNPIATTFFTEDDVRLITPPLDDATLQREQPQDFREALQCLSEIDTVTLTGDYDTDHNAIRQHLIEQNEQRKTQAHANGIASRIHAQHHGSEPNGSEPNGSEGSEKADIERLRQRLNHRLQTLYGSRYTLDGTAIDVNGLFDEPVTVGQRTKWRSLTIGQIGVCAAATVLLHRECHDPQLTAQLSKSLANKRLATAIGDVLADMLEARTMPGGPDDRAGDDPTVDGAADRAVDNAIGESLRMLREQAPDRQDPTGTVSGEEGESDTSDENDCRIRPDRRIALKTLSGLLEHLNPGFQAPRVDDLDQAEQYVMDSMLEFGDLDGFETENQAEDLPEEQPSEEGKRIILGLTILAASMPDRVIPLFDDTPLPCPRLVSALMNSIEETHATLIQARNDNDANDDYAEQESLSDTINLLLHLLRQAHRRLRERFAPQAVLQCQ